MAIQRNERLGYATGFCKLRMGPEMARFTMHGDYCLGPEPFIHGFELTLARVARRMNEGLVGCDHINIKLRQIVVNERHILFISRNCARRENDSISLFERNMRVLVFANPCNCGTGFTLASSAEQHDLVDGEITERFLVKKFAGITEV